MHSHGNNVIVSLQGCMDLLEAVHASCSERCITSCDKNQIDMKGKKECMWAVSPLYLREECILVLFACGTSLPRYVVTFNILQTEYSSLENVPGKCYAA
jgi:hypothetical protein